MSEETKVSQTVYQKLASMQNALKVPKGQSNSGKYNYRNLEDIEKAIKPILKDLKALCYLSYHIENIGDRNYVVATATFVCLEFNDKIVVTGTAREPVSNNAKMDGSQITGASSSYAGKYVLGGLFLIDDTKDADSYHDPNQTQQIQYITEKQCEELQSLVDNNTVGREPKAFKDAILKHHNIASFAEIPWDSFGTVKNKITRAE